MTVELSEKDTNHLHFLLGWALAQSRLRNDYDVVQIVERLIKIVYAESLPAESESGTIWRVNGTVGRGE